MNGLLGPYPGELAALLAALLWAVSSHLYRRAGTVLSPLRLNVAKNTVAGLLLLATVFLGGASWAGLDGRAVALLAASGLIGIGIGDTFYLSGLNLLGPRRILLLGTLAPPIAALTARLVLAEQLAPLDWAGMALTLAGVGWVVMERTPDILKDPKRLKKGLLVGIGAAACQAQGAVLSRSVLSGQVVDPLVSAVIRIAAGALLPLLVLLHARGRRPATGKALNAKTIALAGAAILMGTYGGIWLQQVALKHTETGIAQTLISTSPLWILPIAAILGEKVSLRAVLGALMAFGGVGLLLR